MKKILVALLLILAIVSSLLAGTIAYYTTSIDIAAGSVTAKEFIFLGEGSQSFTHKAAIAPSETVEWSFTVKNYKDSLVTETDQFYKLIFSVTKAQDKEAIEPLVVKVLDEAGRERNFIQGPGSFEILDKFPLNTAGQSHSYKVVLYWPSGSNDTAYAGNHYGSAVTVKAIASQVPFDSTPVDPVEPGEPGPGETDPEGPDGTEISDYHMILEADPTYPEEGLSKYKFQITILNKSTEDVVGWAVAFRLPDTKYSRHDNSNLVSDGTSNGHFAFTNPDNYNKVIGAGESIGFGGHFLSLNGEVNTPEQVTVNGQPATVEVIRR